ncbi:ComF family protein [Campylobacter iguaniorum]|uniref:ComF family protein n=1 Tax=Campylobacter iguaniorum TaxID=1244531 RepID=UPI0007C8F789|nr:ComF family protein [Campylobacter iguaniorum]
MRCLKCGKFSFKFICNECKFALSEFENGVRYIDGFKVYYFYKYDSIKNLLYAKHQMHGHFVFKALANLSFKKFAKEFEFGSAVNAIPLDDNIRSGYSHTAVLARALKSPSIAPAYRALRAKSSVKYTGKSLEFRQKNPRNFELLKSIKNPVILVDDIITTGTSMKEAKNLLIKNGITPLFGLVLADARD